MKTPSYPRIVLCSLNVLACAVASGWRWPGIAQAGEAVQPPAAVPQPSVTMVTADPAAAGQRPVVVHASNGTPVVNIVAPDVRGLSHNKFSSLQVGAPGLVFNNSQQDGVTKIGGYTLKNGSLLAGRPASAILAEVTGSQASKLAGTLEVFGERADLIIANPNGLSINGLSTQNVRGLGLVVGRSVDAQGTLAVRANALAIDSGGINITGTSYVDLVARQITLAGQVADSADAPASELRLLGGSNDYNALARTFRYAGEGKELPQVVIDGSAAGSLYAGQVRLLVTGAGAGVRHAGQILGSGDVQLDAQGEVQVGAVQAGGDLLLRAGTLRLLGGDLLAGRNVQIQAGWLDQPADVMIRAGRAGQGDLNLTVAGDYAITDDPASPRHGQAILWANGDLKLQAANLRFGGARIEAAGRLWLTTDGSVQNDGQIVSGGAATISAQSLVVGGAGSIEARDTLALQVTQQFSNAGRVQGSNGLDIQAGTLTLSQADKAPSGGLLAAQQGAVVLQVDGALALSGNSAISAGTELKINSGGGVELKNTARLYGSDALSIVAQDAVRNFDNAQIVSAGSLSVQAKGAVENDSSGASTDLPRASMLAKTLDVSSGLGVTNRAGRLYGAERLAVSGADISNEGAQALLTSGGAIELRAENELNNKAGATIVAVGNLTASAAVVSNAGVSEDKQPSLMFGRALTVTGKASLTNADGAILGALGAITLTADNIDNRHASIQAGAADEEAAGPVLFGAGRNPVGNRLAGVRSGAAEGEAGNDDLTLAGALRNTDGAIILARGALSLSGPSVLNDAATLQGHSMDAHLDGTVTNQNGASMRAAESISVTAEHVLNDRSTIVSPTLAINALSQLQNKGGQLLAQDAMTLGAGQQLSNEAGGRISAGSLQAITRELLNNGARIEAVGILGMTVRGKLDNNGGGLLAGGEVNLGADGIVNTAASQVTAAHNLSVTAASVLNQDGGAWTAGGTLSIDAASLANQALPAPAPAIGGVITAGGDVRLNQGSRLGKQGQVDNLAGKILAGGALLLDGALNNKDTMSAGTTFTHTGGQAAAGSVAVKQQVATTVSMATPGTMPVAGRYSAPPDSPALGLLDLATGAGLLGQHQGDTVLPEEALSASSLPRPADVLPDQLTGLAAPAATTQPVMESRPVYLDAGLFFGTSNYNEQVGLDPDRALDVHINAGGTSFLWYRRAVKALDGYAQFRQVLTSPMVQDLLERGTKAAPVAGLLVGVAPTSAQLARVADDFLWYEWSDDGGRVAMTPKLYRGQAQPASADEVR